MRRSSAFGVDARMAMIVQVVERLAPGGLETLALDLTKRLGSDSRIFSLQGRGNELAEAWPALNSLDQPVECFDRKPGVNIALIGVLRRRLIELKPAAVIVHHIGPLLYAGIAARLAGVRSLIHVEHDAWHYRSQKSHRAILRFAVHILRPRRVAVSAEVAATAAGIARARPPIVIGPGIDMARFSVGDRCAARIRLGLSKHAKVVGSVGRLVPVKGYDILLRAIASMPADLHLVLIGDGPEKQRLRSMARELGIAERVHDIGHVDEVETLLPAFDVFCLSSHNEGLPRALLEAQAADLPVVATSVGGVPEAVCPTTGVLVPPGDPMALAQALKQALTAERLPGTARSFIRSHFDLTDVAKAYENLLRTASTA